MDSRTERMIRWDIRLRHLPLYLIFWFSVCFLGFSLTIGLIGQIWPDKRVSQPVKEVHHDL